MNKFTFLMPVKTSETKTDVRLFKMKNITTLVLLLLPIIVQAQITESVFNKKSNWIEVTTNLMDSTIFELSTYKIDGDTLMSGKKYLKLFRNDQFYSGLRETDDHRIYALFPDLYYPFPDRELLIYDFEWYPGKELYFQMADEGDSILLTILGNNIDSVQLLDGKFYKCLKNDEEEVRLIRGIGDTDGFFNATFGAPTDGSQFALLCFYIDDTLVYSNSDFDYCEPNSIIETENEPKIHLYPNPSNGNTTIELPKNLNINTFKIFDAKGSLIKTYNVRNKEIIEIKNLATGLYIYTAITDNNQKLSGKIIIK